MAETLCYSSDKNRGVKCYSSDILNGGMTMLKETRYLNEKTGELSQSRYKKFEIFNNDGYLLWAKKGGRKQFHDIKLSDALGKGEDFRRAHILAELIYKETNTIMIRENTRKVRVADVYDISMLIGLNIRRTREFLNRMVLKSVLARRIDKVGELVSEKYLFNPLFFMCSKRLSADLYFLFKDSLDCYLPAYVVEEFHRIGNIAGDEKKPVKKVEVVNPIVEKVKAIKSID
jgi:hypothetical protein